MEVPPGLILSAIPVDELAGRVERPLAETLLATMPEIIRRGRLPEFLDGEAAAAELSMTERQLRHLRSTRRIPYVKVGPRQVLYPTAALFEAVRAGLVPVRQPVPA